MLMSLLPMKKLSPRTAVILMAASISCLIAAGSGSITRLSVDPEASVVPMFEAIESGQIQVRMTAMNPREGRVFFTNKTDKPLTIAVPKAIVGMHVLPQVGNAGNGLFGPAAGNNGNNQGNAGAGLAQSVGGILGAIGNNAPGVNGFGNVNGNGNANGNGINGFGNLPAGNFFSVPPEKTVQLAFRSVCLNHGRPDPNPGMKYQVTKLESYTSDPVLQQLLENDSSTTNRDAQQAAAWHVANGMSWSALAGLTTQPVPGVKAPLFKKSQLEAAKKLVEAAEKDAHNRPAKAGSSAALVSSTSQ